VVDRILLLAGLGLTDINGCGYFSVPQPLQFCVPSTSICSMSERHLGQRMAPDQYMPAPLVPMPTVYRGAAFFPPACAAGLR
jgi:hypothetical protein